MLHNYPYFVCFLWHLFQILSEKFYVHQFARSLICENQYVNTYLWLNFNELYDTRKWICNLLDTWLVGSSCSLPPQEIVSIIYFWKQYTLSFLILHSYITYFLILPLTCFVFCFFFLLLTKSFNTTEAQFYIFYLHSFRVSVQCLITCAIMSILMCILAYVHINM